MIVRPLLVVLLVASTAAADPTADVGQTWIDVNQATALQSSARLHCLRIHQDHRAGRSVDDCVMIDGGTMEARVADRPEENWPLHLAGVWCEGNRYLGGEHRFQIHGKHGCEQVCDLAEEVKTCITRADIGREARRRDRAWRHVGEFALVERPSERVSHCTPEQDHAEAWRVEVLGVDRLEPHRRGIDPLPDYTAFEQPISVHVICPDGVAIEPGRRFRALVAYGDKCLPWSSGHESPCLFQVDPEAASP